MGSTTFVNCIFLQNTSSAGGAVYCDNDGSPTFIGCSFFGNTAVSGGAFYSQTTSPGIPTLINCVFASNTASSDGGALFVDGISTIRVVNCTLTNNVAIGNGSGIFNGALVNTTVTNCILWGNVGSELAGPATVTFSNVQGGFAGQGNIDANPLFLNPLNTDLRLSCGSPCLDAGTNAPGVSLPALDHEGRDQRVIGLVDMGADEMGAFWSFNGPAVIGGAPVSFTATAGPAQNGNLAFLGVSFGNGSATGGISLPIAASSGRSLLLDLDPVLFFWLSFPAAFNTVILSGCAGSSTSGFAIPAVISPGTIIFYAGITLNGAGQLVSVTETRSFSTQ
jgi:predicted outer membrane repeat protein